MTRGIMVLAVMVLTVTQPAPYRPIPFAPVDQAQDEPELVVFRQRLLDVAERRAVDELLSLASQTSPKTPRGLLKIGMSAWLGRMAAGGLRSLRASDSNCNELGYETVSAADRRLPIAD